MICRSTRTSGQTSFIRRTWPLSKSRPFSMQPSRSPEMATRFRWTVPVILGAFMSTGVNGRAPDWVPAQQPTEAQSPAMKSDRILVRYSQRDVKDQDLADLANAIARANPVETWPTIRVQSNEGLLGIIDRAYDFFLGPPQDGDSK